MWVLSDQYDLAKVVRWNFKEDFFQEGIDSWGLPFYILPPFLLPDACNVEVKVETLTAVLDH